MNSIVIKFVAGGGKTSESIRIMSTQKNGLYLAFTKSVVKSLNYKGYLSKTIDSFFTSFIIPKFTSVINLVGTGSRIEYVSTQDLPYNLKGVANIKIDLYGNLYNKSKRLNININDSNEYLHKIANGNNVNLIKYIFGKDKLRLTDEFRSNFIEFLLYNYPNQIINFIKYRFSFVIIDEAQDLDKHRESFAKLLYKSNVKLILLGDDNQNIINGGIWFEKLLPIKIKNRSFRCPENNCKWIRDNLKIEIYGNSNVSCFVKINYNQILEYDNNFRVLLYNAKAGKNKNIVDAWHGPKYTIKTAKGSTIDSDIVILGETLNKKSYYTAITRTTKNVYSTIKKIN